MKIFYEIDFSQKDQKYVWVEANVELENYEKNSTFSFIMPVWSPGSYLIRDYARHLDCLTADVQNNKVSKNKWVFNLESQNNFRISYRLYCNDLTVRTNYVDDIHALLVGPATFLIPEDKNICNHFEVKIHLPKKWHKISTGLKKKNETTYYHENLDDFLDCPIEAGDYKTLNFNSFGKDHEIAIIGPKVYDDEKLVADIKNIVENTAKVIDNTVPYEKYNFIIHLTNELQGGLEHKNSCVLHFKKWDFQDPEKYKKDWLSLVSHEYFHLWNIKRIKPVELSDFDYNNENYTSLLWFAEGFTSYYDDLILRRAGIYSEEEYLTVLSGLVEKLVKIQGRFYQSLEESSFDAWTKFYKKHENINNQGISYYVKGAQFALFLDLEIRKRTKNKKSFDDVLKKLWQDYLEDNSVGYTREKILAYSEEVAGDLKDFFSEFLDKAIEINYDEYLAYAGLKLNVIDFDKPTLDMTLKEEKGCLVCTEIKDKGAAYHHGFMVGDEILAMDGYRVNHLNLVKRLKYMKVGTKVKLLIARDERIIEKEIIVSGSKCDQVIIEKVDNLTEEQKNLYENWIKIN